MLSTQFSDELIASLQKIIVTFDPKFLDQVFFQTILQFIYTPGIAKYICGLKNNFQDYVKFTDIERRIYFISNGTATLGIGDQGIGIKPLLESKALILNQYLNQEKHQYNVIDLFLDIKDQYILKECIQGISSGCRLIILEDVRAAEARFVLENTNSGFADIIHDDNHCTSVVVLAALHQVYSYWSDGFRGKKFVINGFGSAGRGLAEMLDDYGCSYVAFNSKGRTDKQQTLEEFLDSGETYDVFVDLSPVKTITTSIAAKIKCQVALMLANPFDEALLNHLRCFVIGTGTEINNYKAFPIFVKMLLQENQKQTKTTLKDLIKRASLVVKERFFFDLYILKSKRLQEQLVLEEC